MTYLVKVRNYETGIKPIFFNNCPKYKFEDKTDLCFDGINYCESITNKSLYENRGNYGLIQCEYNGGCNGRK
ncbi:MAG: hypothetical protein GQ540_03530 [Lutibacter sp.]|uniref:hypothetical protein n=1 Tax=Lutibacter sp. TaxID=1925666 RepID=UPI0019EA75EB|nr:hypothetical protein [Lutibacter sp.]NOR27583.1 hypothetical protein [Lutibacter sp.]